MAPYSVLEINKGDLTSRWFRPRSSPKIFFAHRFFSEKSKKFRRDLEIQIKNTEGLNDIEIIDGHVATGRRWASEIRERVNSCRLVVADMTSLSPEVLFECGLAWGMNKRIMPVVEDSNMIEHLPDWLTDLQFGFFSTTKGIEKILDSIGENINKADRLRKRRGIPKPIPGKIVWLKGGDEFERYRNNLKQMAFRYELELPEPEEEKPPSLDEANESLLNEISKASLLIASLTYSFSDPFIHFATGVVVSKPMAGESYKKLKRHVILVIPNNLPKDEVISVSAKKWPTIVQFVSFEQFKSELIKFGKKYKKYIQSVSDTKI